jgi:hypothetical protein
MVVKLPGGSEDHGRPQQTGQSKDKGNAEDEAKNRKWMVRSPLPE